MRPEQTTTQATDSLWRDRLYEHVTQAGESSVDPEAVRRSLNSFLDTVTATGRFTWLGLVPYRDELNEDRLALCLYGDIFRAPPGAGNPRLHRAEPSVGKAFIPLKHAFRNGPPLDLYFVNKPAPSPTDLSEGGPFLLAEQIP